MSITRRNLLQFLGAAAAAGALPAGIAQAGRPIPWRNWSGAQRCIPAARVAPAGEGELAEVLRTAKGTVRAVGAGHSFSPLVPTDGTLVTLDRMTGMHRHDKKSLQAEFLAGTRLGNVGEPLAGVGQALDNMPDIDQQTLAGAIATSTHGTGMRFGSLSTQVAGLRLVTADGEIVECSADREKDIFNAARVSLGCLGIVTRVRLQNRMPYRLHEKNWLQRTDELLEQVTELRDGNRHFEMLPITHSDYALAITLNETDQPATPRAEVDGSDSVELLRYAHKYGRGYPDARRNMMNLLARFIESSEQIGESWQVFANVRDIRFNEMEYQVPAEAGPECLREVLKTIRDNNLNTWFPLEYRYVKGDDIWLSPFYGRDTASISVHQYYEMDYHDYFARIEPIFWKYGGRPHWGKLHSLNAGQLADLYPRWGDFLAVRELLDPDGRFLNGHLREALGVRCRA